MGPARRVRGRRAPGERGRLRRVRAVLLARPGHGGGFRRAGGQALTAIEVKSGRAPQAHPGIAAFKAAFKPHRALLVGRDGIATEEFLARPVAHWVQA